MLSVGKVLGFLTGLLQYLAKIMGLLFLLNPVSGYSQTKKMTLVAGPLKKLTLFLRLPLWISDWLSDMDPVRKFDCLPDPDSISGRLYPEPAAVDPDPGIWSKELGSDFSR